MLTINAVKAGANSSEGITGSIWIGLNVARKVSIPVHP
jgi:hypothetical protein